MSESPWGVAVAILVAGLTAVFFPGPAHAASPPALVAVRSAGRVAATPAESGRTVAAGVMAAAVSSHAVAGTPVVSPATASDAQGTFVSISPVRMLDTRPGHGTTDGVDAGIGPVLAGQPHMIQITGRGGVPTTAEAVVLNVTVTGATGSTYVKVFPVFPAPVASTVNVLPGQTVAVAATVGLSPGDAFGQLPGQVLVTNNNGALQVIMDVTGYYLGAAVTAGSVFHPQAPVRVLDTRTDGLGAIASHHYEWVGLSIVGTNAVALNVTAVAGSGPGYLTVWPGAAATPPATSTVNFTPHQVVANMTVVGASGATPSFSVGNGGASPVDVVVDVVGWYSSAPSLAAGGLRFTPVSPVRIVDTRTPTGLAGPIAAGGTGVVTTSTAVGDGNTQAIVANLTALGDSASTFLAAFPGPTWGGTSSLNLAAQQTGSNMIMTGVVGPTRTFDLLNHTGSAQVLVDLAGYFDAPAPASVVLVSDTATPAFDRPVTLTATVTPTAGGTPAAGKVSFVDQTNGVTFAVVPLSGSTAALTTSALLAGGHALEAVYVPDGSLGSATSPDLAVTVAAPTTAVVGTHQQDGDHDGDAVGATITSTLHKAWSAELAGTSQVAVSSPAVGDKLYALDLGTGAVDWSHATDGSMVAYDGQRVFTVSGSGKIDTYDPVTGTPDWSIQLSNVIFGVWAPTTYDGVLYISTSGRMYAVSELDGTVLWSLSTALSQTGAIVDADASGVYVAIPCARHNGYTLDGVQRWQSSASCTEDGFAAAAHGGLAYVMGDTAAANPPVVNLTTGDVVGSWTGSAPPAFDATKRYVRGGNGNPGDLTAVTSAGATAWNFTGDGPFVSPPDVGNGLVFVESNLGTLYAVDAVTGLSVWSGATGVASVDNGAWADGRDAGNAMGLVIAGSTVLAPSTGADGSTWGSLTAFTTR